MPAKRRRSIPKSKPLRDMRIAMLGTFDTENYGDLLFPLLAERRLRNHFSDLTLDPVSPAGGPPVWGDSPSSIMYDDFLGRRKDYQGFLVGGGNIIRVTPSNLEAYNKGMVPVLGYANLWAGLAAKNYDNHLPICWNAPGVPTPFPPSLHPLLRTCLERFDYLSVRDGPSRDLLKDVAPDIDISIVPDPAWEVDALWTPDDLDTAYRNAFALRRMAIPDRSVAIHLNSRYLGGATIDTIAAGLDGLCCGLQAKGILIGIGPCHGDDELARTVAERMRTAPLVIDRPRSLKEVAACISRSVAYIGSSMHGFITASSFCVPAVVVASPGMIKFPGLLSQIGVPDLLHQSWPEAIEHVKGLASADGAQALQQVRQEQKVQLDAHWSKISALFQASPQEQSHRRETNHRKRPRHNILGVHYREAVLGITAVQMFAENQSLRQRHKAGEAEGRKLAAKLQAQEAQAAELKAKLESRNAEAKNLTVKLQAQEARTAEHEAQSKDLAAKLQAQTADLKARLEGQHVEAKDLARKLQAQQAQAADLKAKLEKRDAETQDLAAKLQAQEARAAERDGQIASRDAEIVQFKGELAALEAERKAKNQQVKTLEAQVQENTARLKAKESELRELYPRFADTEQALSQAREKLAALEGELHQGQQQLAQAQGDLAHLQTTLQEEQSHRTSLESQLAQNQQQLQESQHRLQAEQVTRQALEETRQQLDSELKRVQEELEGTWQGWQEEEAIRRSLGADLDRLQVELETSRQRLQAETASRQTLEETHRSLEAERRDLKTKLESRDAEARDLAAKLQVQEAQAADLKAKLAKREAEAKDLTAKLQVQQAQANAKNQQIKTLEEKAARFAKQLSTGSRRIQMLVEWMEGLEEGISALLNSRRWKTGNMLGEVQRRLLRRPRVTMPVDVLSDVLDQFNAWKKNFQKGAKNQEETRKQRDRMKKAIAEAEAAFGAKDWSEALKRWQAVLDGFGENEAAAGHAKLNISVARRLSNIDAYRRQIAEYVAARATKTLQPSKDRRIVIYTAISANYDSIKLPERPDSQLDYVLFTDRPVPDTGIYQVRPITYFHVDATRAARFVKTHPHMLLDGYDIAIWIDPNIMILGDIYPLVEAFLASGKAVAAVPHPLRKSIYDELEACIARKKDDAEIMREQLSHYASKGFDHDDLIESGLMMFNLRNNGVRPFLDAWWAEIERYSKRDQLSLNYALKQAGVESHQLMEQPNSFRNHPVFAFVRHDSGDSPASKLIDALQVPYVDPYAGPSYADVRDQRIAAQKHRKIDIVVCVHDALEDVKLCLDSIRRTRNSEHQRLIIIDDGSDRPTARYLEDFAGSAPWIELHRNEQPRGYPKAANQGLAASTGELVILLNSDTIVTDGWAEKMADAVFSIPGAGIVGPMSNAASHQSIPEHRSSKDQTAINELPPGLTAEDMNRYCEQWTTADVLPRVPLVHGFCLGVTREVMNRIGFFDADRFPKGYGEENDYCFRAVDAGFSLVVATHTYIFHSKSKSYAASERVPLRKAGSEAFKQLYGRARIERAVRSMEEDPIFVDLRQRARRLTECAMPQPSCRTSKGSAAAV